MMLITTLLTILMAISTFMLIKWFFVDRRSRWLTFYQFTSALLGLILGVIFVYSFWVIIVMTITVLATAGTFWLSRTTKKRNAG